MRKIVAALAFAAMLLPIVASAADWQPNRPVEFVVAAGAGGGSDIFARTVQSIIVKYNLMPQPIVVLNKGGGSGAEARRRSARTRATSSRMLNGFVR